MGSSVQPDPLDAIWDTPKRGTPKKVAQESTSVRRPQKQAQKSDPLDDIYADKPKQEPVGHVEGIARSLGRINPLAADWEGIVGATPFLGGDTEGATWTERFKKARKASQERNAQYNQESPWVAKTAETVGTTAGMLGPGMAAKAAGLAGEVIPTIGSMGGTARTALGRLGQSMGEGSLWGHVYGLGGSKDPGLQSRLKSGAEGAVMGGLVSAPLHVAASGVSMLANRQGLKGRALKQIQKRLEAEGETPEGLNSIARRTEAQGGPGPEIGADYSTGLRQMTADVAKVQDPAAARLRRQVEQRDIRAPQRISREIDALGPNDARREMVETANKYAASSKRNIPTAYRADQERVAQGDEPVGTSDVIQSFLKTPMGRKVMGQVKIEAANKPRKLPSIKKTFEEPSGPKSLLTDAPQAQAVPVNGPANEPRFQNPIIQAVIEKAETPELKARLIADMRAQGAPEVKAPMAPVTPASKVTVTKKEPVMDAEGLHYALQIAERWLKSGFSGKGKLLSKDAANLKGFIKAIKGEMGSLAPELEGALSTSAAGKREGEALRMGQGFRQYGTLQGPKGSVPTPAKGEGVPREAYGGLTGITGLESAMEKMSPENQELARTGMRSALRDEMAQVERTPGAGARALKSFPATPEANRWMRLLHENDVPLDQLRQLLNRERNMSATAEVMPSLGTKPDNQGVAHQEMNELMHTYSGNPWYLKMKAARGLARAMIGDPSGQIASELSQPAAGLANALMERQRKQMQGISLQDVLRSAGLRAYVGDR